MRILIVEDEPVIGDAVSRGLRADGFVVEIAADGVEGLWQAREGDFDLVILDIMLPGMNGYEVCRQVRAAGLDVPILMLTAKDGEYEVADALDLGADDYLVKPFSYVVLLARIRSLLRRAPTSRAPMLSSGTLQLDPATRRCWRADEEITLTTREFRLLEYLLRRKGDVLTRQSIADHVWDSELDIDSNVIEVYIGYLRRKLDRPFGSDDIETVRGVGYRLRDHAPGNGTRR